ncbi:MAG: metallophosphoesterase [Bacteroidia bacterium]|nr:metallophosphoesterase [Bacteroidia bacterium]
MKRIIAVALLILVGSAVAFSQIRLMVVSDLGRNGYYEQRNIAELMGSYAEKNDLEAILALGDTHHYMGIQSISDPLWISNFESIYSHPELQIPWYPILGNHEYRGNTQAVIDYSNVSRRWQMAGRYYTKVFTSKESTLRVIFLDTAPLIDKYYKDSIDYPDVQAQDMNKQLSWLDDILKNAKEDWIVVVGHHPIFADTPKSSSERTDLQRRLNPILLRYNVSMYICGHIHNFQHIKLDSKGIDYIVNTSGSLSRQTVNDVEGTIFNSGKEGFSVLSCTKDSLKLDLIDNTGQVIHTITRNK